MARTVRVMHFADTHFGVELYGRLDPETGLNTRLKDFKQSLLQAVEMALEAGIDLAVFAGDAYKTRDPRQTDQREFADCIRRLTDRGIPVALLVGNHDMPSIKGRANAVEIYRTLGVTNVHVFSRPEIGLIQTGAGPVRIAAMPYLLKGFSVAREEFQGKTIDETRLMLEAKYVDYLRDLADQVREADDAIPTILLGHFWANGARLSSWQQGYFNLAEPQVPLSALTDPAFDYVALGHIHKHQDLNKNGQPHVVYAGSPDRIDFGEKDEPKGFVLVDLFKGGADYKFVSIPQSRPLLDIDIDADCEEPTEKIISEIQRHSLRNAIVKLTYQIGHGRQGLVREREIREALAPAFMIVAINRKVQRDAAARSRLLTESKSPREALELYIDTRENLKARKEQLLAYAEPLIQQLLEEEAHR
ncbi:MAG TPA: exonuclease SbcCD subunit D [Chthonomonadaceae bacterium]|nr:exonuclease SbcCD subunit D [Chthonomonadaceae bacterium]